LKYQKTIQIQILEYSTRLALGIIGTNTVEMKFIIIQLQNRSITRWKIHIVDGGKHGERQCCKKRYHPNDCDDSDGPLQPGHGVRMEGMTDGQVPFHRKRHDGQNRRV